MFNSNTIPLDNCTNGDLRLTGLSSETQGYVEVCIQSVWSTVADGYASEFEAMTLCRQLGYTGPCKLTCTLFTYNDSFV